MDETTPYVTAIEKLARHAPVKLSYKVRDERLWINNQPFVHYAPGAMRLSEIRSGEGVRGILASKLHPGEVEVCRERGISYLTLEPKLYLVQRGYGVSVEPAKRPPHPRRLLQSSQGGMPQPTALIGPNALNILDALFRAPRSELELTKSVLHFANRYRLSQPRLSMMMRDLKAHTLTELRARIEALPDEWWKIALDYPPTRKRLTPFFLAAKSYTLLHPALEHKVTQMFDGVNETMKNRVAPGPGEVAKSLGLIQDKDLYVWVAGTYLAEFKRETQLIPGSNRSGITVHIAQPHGTFTKEAIVSNHRQVPLSDRSMWSVNCFRAIWDLGFGDSRMREVRISMLRKIMAHGF